MKNISLKISCIICQNEKTQTNNLNPISIIKVFVVTNIVKETILIEPKILMNKYFNTHKTNWPKKLYIIYTKIHVSDDLL